MSTPTTTSDWILTTNPDSAGDTPTLEVVAAAWLLRKHAPSLQVRVVNVADLMCLYPLILHPHGLEEATFIDLFTAAKPVVFAFHGYQRAIHAIVHGRTRAERFHVRGFMEEGTTTTPFDMVVRNEMSRFHLCMEALRRSMAGAPLLFEGVFTVEFCGHVSAGKLSRRVRTRVGARQ